MAVRPIDASRFGEILEQWKKDCLQDNDTQGADIISDVILQLDDMPTLTQPNEPLTETGYFKASGDLALCRCPFCGSEDVVYERYLHTAGYRWRVVCTSCMASIDPGYAQQRSMVQRMWNTRAPILSAGEMVMLEGME